jgi:catechol 2,3-dioxygenase-like lactoylglutathione lyase family enzyme
VSEPVETWAKVVPEFLVSDLRTSLDFWCGIIGFEIAFDRPDDGFAYLNLDGAQVMLEEIDPSRRNWLTAPLERPLGRGINFQIEVADVDTILDRLAAASWPLFEQAEEAWYRVGDRESGQKQFLVQDPDGYLLRPMQWLGDRTVTS